LFGVWCCVARRSFLGETVEPDQVLSVEEALRVHTVNAADAMSLPDRGSLEDGNLADFVVLADDPRAVPVDSIPDIAVDYVFVGGRPVYSRAGAQPPRGSNLSPAGTP
jgi:predicted amidohydrolase YtcJ